MMESINVLIVDERYGIAKLLVMKVASVDKEKGWEVFRRSGLKRVEDFDEGSWLQIYWR